ncbi:MAG: hypothetical protein WBG69_05070 [Arcobacteraceae bacterium]
MKVIILFFMVLSFSYSNTYTFLVNKYDKEVELESKIIENIATASLKEKVILFIPEITENERKIYKKLFRLGKTCEESNFIFVKKNIDKNVICQDKRKLYFTNNYKKLLSNGDYFGAFFWSKSRPNIVFIKNRLHQNNISLPDSYSQFIEDI